MTNEEKLLTLLQIAVKNGFDITQTPHDSLKYDVVEHTLYLHTCRNQSGSIHKQYIELGYTHNLDVNALVTNFEEGEVSFIEALWQTTDYSNELFGRFTNVEMMRLTWISKPTSERLEWLFETFTHLLK